MKPWIITCCCVWMMGVAQAQTVLPQYPDSLFGTYYHQRNSLFATMPLQRNDIVFVGNSITDGNEWAELFSDLRIKNRGISGDVSAGVLHRLPQMVQYKPAKIVLMIGVNDLARGVSADSLLRNIFLIADYVHEQSPSTKLIVQSILPVNAAFGKFGGHTSKAAVIKTVNAQLATQAAKHQYVFADLYTGFLKANGDMQENYTNDGLHLMGEGYLLWKHLIYPYVYDLPLQPALIPMPQQLKWQAGRFPLYKCRNVVVSNDSLLPEAKLLQQWLPHQQLQMGKQKQNEPTIELQMDASINAAVSSEKYALTVTTHKIILKAATRHGLFNGLQTLHQLMRDAVMIPAVSIQDWPAFPVRGFMVDVGRNFQSMQQLKAQIDVMAAYKLNVFHFHLTEDIAWRLQSRRYPQLTAPQHMQRNAGEYYSVADMQELIAYCKERHITLIPEIDMPGHSADFERAMGVNMQSDSGMAICKNILREFCETYDLSAIHIGGDEVKITNQRFLPEMVALLKSLGKQVWAWDPGGNVPKGTYLQMWNGNTKVKEGYPAVDSRHLYLNHFDPLDGVVTTYYHQICDVDTATADARGAILCNWPDRRVSVEADLIRMNAVYPVMLTFAERTWQGKGWKNYTTAMAAKGTAKHAAFAAFEQRLLAHQQQYFQQQSFPYWPQANIEWTLIGPYKNAGKLQQSFAPEQPAFWDTVKLQQYPTVTGGTIWLRHFWHPMIPSHLAKPTDSTTWYAVRKVWCNEAGMADAWIGFNDLSRSTATHSLPAGAWDDKGSEVWVNGQRIAPPQWQRAGQQGYLEIPYTDEGYAYRPPTKIFFQKGWNTVLIKAPVGSFRADWQQPVKWMFTFLTANTQ